MKIITLATVCLFLFLSSSICAQDSGVIIYEMKLDLHAAIPKEQAALKALIPKEKTTKIKLSFDKEYAKVEMLPDKNKNRGGVFIDTGNEEPFYIDLKNKSRIEIIELDGIFYGALIPLEPQNAPLENKSKNYLDYDCIAFEREEILDFETRGQKESKAEGNNKSLIWVAPKLPKGISPLGTTYWEGSLLGFQSAVLSYEVKDISFESVKKETVTPPSNFKKVSEEQMQDLKEEKRELLMSKNRF